MKLAYTCMFAPRLYKIYKEGPVEAVYQPQGLEKWSDKVVTSFNTMFNIALYTSPFMCMYLYRRGNFSYSEARSVLQVFGGLGCLLMVSVVLRGIGRGLNPKYVAFVNALSRPSTEKQALLDAIRKYDFEPSAWPVTYSVSTPARPVKSWMDNPFNRCANPELPWYKRFGIQVLAYLATHTFGLRLIYPGSVSVINNILWKGLLVGRAMLVEDFDALRARIGTADNNAIDTMFIDKRPSQKGKTLVICCEGNSGFYEIGLMTVPAKGGFSVLGWNHPGFGGSTGQPYPSQENSAIDAVLQYAIQELGFLPENIIMYGWSIGGYSAAWAGAHYPVQGLVLDATFDDLLALAEKQMPSSWALLVKEVVRSHVDLHVAELVSKYDGPVQLVRRTDDEIICLRHGYLSTNRGNHLLLRLIDQRHPGLPPAVVEYLRRFVALTDWQRSPMLYSSTDDYELLALKLISSYMRDLKSTHCPPLPEQQFEAIVQVIMESKKKQ